MSPENDAIIFRCEPCGIVFPSRVRLTLHNAAKHKPSICSICNSTFDSRGKLGLHKIEAHGYSREQLGWGLVSGWNRGLYQVEAFGTKKPHHGTPDFMRHLNDPEMLERKKITRQHHEAKVLQKELELRAKGFRTFCTSNYLRHKRVPDIIAVSPDGKVIAVEMESLHPYKDSIEYLRKKYTALLLEEGFFDDVVVEGFLRPKFDTEDSNMEPAHK
jgi:hypothetical protein